MSNIIINNILAGPRIPQLPWVCCLVISSLIASQVTQKSTSVAELVSTPKCGAEFWVVDICPVYTFLGENVDSNRNNLYSSGEP